MNKLKSLWIIGKAGPLPNTVFESVASINVDGLLKINHTIFNIHYE
jgi:hypothetical protein